MCFYHSNFLGSLQHKLQKYIFTAMMSLVMRVGVEISKCIHRFILCKLKDKIGHTQAIDRTRTTRILVRILKKLAVITFVNSSNPALNKIHMWDSHLHSHLFATKKHIFRKLPDGTNAPQNSQMVYLWLNPQEWKKFRIHTSRPHLQYS